MNEPPGKRIGPAGGPDRPEADSDDDGLTLAPRFENPEKEARFRRDQAGWRRRIECARRLSYDARDELVAPFNGGKWTQR